MSKIILITGGSSGIGKMVGIYLQEKGYKVYGTSRTPDAFLDTPFPLVELDVRNVNSIQTCVANVIAEAGTIDVLINNAGVGITGPLEEIPIEAIKDNFETNLFGPIEMIKAVLPVMREQQSGLIINVTSIAGYMGLPFRSVYSSSKGALEVLTEAIRMEVKPFGIDITNVAPGDFATNIASRRFHAPVVKGSPYETVYAAQLDKMNTHVASGSDPIEMAVIIDQIIKTKKTKIHYKVGASMQKISIILKRILPDTVFERLIMNHYDLK